MDTNIKIEVRWFVYNIGMIVINIKRITKYSALQKNAVRYNHVHETLHVEVGTIKGDESDKLLKIK